MVDKMLIVYCQIRDMVTDQQTGKMRLQFWRDTIDTIYQVMTEWYWNIVLLLVQRRRAPEHPVAMALAHVSSLHNSDLYCATELLNTRVSFKENCLKCGLQSY